MLLVVQAGCGYHLAGSGGFPSGIDSVCVVVFENHTSQTGVETIFTNSLLHEISRRRGVSLASRKEAAATLFGSVASVRADTISHREAYVSAERRVRVVLHVKLVDASGKVVWSADNIAGDEEYIVAADKLQTENNKKEALRVLSEDMAESIYNRITADF